MSELNFIEGEWRGAKQSIERENPAHPNEIVSVYPNSGEREANAAFDAAARAFPLWRDTSIIQRARVMQKAARILENDLESAARDVACEVGKPIFEARLEVRRAVDLLDYYASSAWQPQGFVVPSARPQTELRAKRVPLGVVALITPWNFPIAIPTWKLAPALIAGNAIVLKPATYGAAGALHLIRALEQAGIPRGVVNLVIGRGAMFGKAMAEHPAVRALSFTGSVEVGNALKRALASRNLRVQLELGSKNPFLVWRDADLNDAARLATEGAFFYAGQKCTATSRVIVHQDVYEPFREKLIAATNALVMGEPLDEATRVGPLIDRASERNVAEYVEKGKADGGRVLCGGNDYVGDGYFYPPTILENVPLDAELAQSEVFGPLVTLHAVTSLDEMIQAANATEYGLSASISTRDVQVMETFLNRVEAGLLHVNQPTAGVEYQAPFGGTRASGFGPKEQGWSAFEFYSDWRTHIVRS